MKTRWQEYKEKNGVTPLDLLNPRTKLASEEVFIKRYSLCTSCPEFINISKQCKKCGCFMASKAKLQLAKCPIGKW
jgi:hypothetical protein